MYIQSKKELACEWSSENGYAIDMRLCSQDVTTIQFIKLYKEAGLSEFHTQVTSLQLRLGKPWRFRELNKFHYVYILVSETDETPHYTGTTENLESRLKAHNDGQVPHTSKYRPWRIETAIAFSCPQKDGNFEKYLKSDSCRAFAKKRL